MGQFSVIRDVSISLQKIIKNNIPDLNKEKAICFESPAELDPLPETPPKLNLSIFLYQIAENSYLKNNNPEPWGLNDMIRPALMLDLYYLFTPYANDRETELIVLENILQLFHNNPVLKEDKLYGSLNESGNDEIRMIHNPLSFEEINKLWERFPNKPFKLSIAYMATPIRIPSEKTYEAHRITEKVIEIYRMEKKHETEEDIN